MAINCSGSSETLKEELHKVCKIWEYQLLFDKALESIALYYEDESQVDPTIRDLATWIDNHSMQANNLLQKLAAL